VVEPVEPVKPVVYGGSLPMNLFKHKFSKELDGLPESRIYRIFKQYVKNTDRETTLERIAKTQKSYLKEKDANNTRRIRLLKNK
jgi:predicted transcriptional regulator